jgi:hypothetical protein
MQTRKLPLLFTNKQIDLMQVIFATIISPRITKIGAERNTWINKILLCYYQIFNKKNQEVSGQLNTAVGKRSSFLITSTIPSVLPHLY